MEEKSLRQVRSELVSELRGKWNELQCVLYRTHLTADDIPLQARKELENAFKLQIDKIEPNEEGFTVYFTDGSSTKIPVEKASTILVNEFLEIQTEIALTLRTLRVLNYWRSKL